MGYGARRWSLVAAATVGLVVLLAVGFVVGRATGSSGEDKPAGPPAAVRTVGGVTVGVLQTRAGALAAADNYATQVAGTQLSDLDRYREFLQTAFLPSAQRKALVDAERIQRQLPQNAAFYRKGGRRVTMIAARRLKSYGGGQAVVETWLGNVIWGPGQKPQQDWQLVSISLRWDQGAWRVASVGRLQTPGPAPSIVLSNDGDDTRAFFDKNLAGMTQPIYGAR